MAEEMAEEDQRNRRLTQTMAELDEVWEETNLQPESECTEEAGTDARGESWSEEIPF